MKRRNKNNTKWDSRGKLDEVWKVKKEATMKMGNKESKENDGMERVKGRGESTEKEKH